MDEVFLLLGIAVYFTIACSPYDEDNMATLIGSNWGSDHLCCCYPKFYSMWLFIYPLQQLLYKHRVHFWRETSQDISVGKREPTCVSHPAEAASHCSGPCSVIARGISAWAKHSPERHSHAKNQHPASPEEKLELRQVKLSTRKCSIFVLLSMLNKECEKFSIENDTEVKWLPKGYKFH